MSESYERDESPAEKIDRTMDDALPDQLDDDRLGDKPVGEPGLDAVWGDDEAED